MNTFTKADAVANFHDIRSQIRLQASNAEKVKVSGDHYEVVDSFQVSAPTGNYTIRKGSFFDDDLKTRDKVSIDMAPTPEGIKESRSYEHYSQKKAIFWTDERLQVSLKAASNDAGMRFSFSDTSDFSI